MSDLAAGEQVLLVDKKGRVVARFGPVNTPEQIGEALGEYL